MNFLYDKFPDYTYINKQKFKLQSTNYKDYIKLYDLLQEKEINEVDKYIFIIEQYYKTPYAIRDVESAIEGLIAFYSVNRPYYEEHKEITIEEADREPILSFKQDDGLIIASFLQFYNIDLTKADYMHWWKFRLLLDNLDNNSNLSEIMAIRGCSLSKISDKTERARVRKLKQHYRIEE